MKTRLFHNLVNYRRWLLLLGTVVPAMLAGGCMTTYTPVEQVPVRDLILMVSDANGDRHVYLDHNSISGSRLSPDWRHATVITSFDKSTSEQNDIFGSSAATEVTFDCRARALRFNLIRTYTQPMAQGVARGTATYDSEFEAIQDTDSEGITMYNSVCADFLEQAAK